MRFKMKKNHGLSIGMGTVFAIVFWHLFHDWKFSVVMGVVFFVIFQSLNAFKGRKGNRRH